ncbi:MAG: hypothetical protein LH631_03915 [Alkalinema sp. CAN_BIN05]|nr:hypothetical protein [Alkalinema sp. CAN_BIN05]
MAKLVVDTSVAAASGHKQTKSPPKSECCHNFLMAVEECGHSIVMNKEILAEWKEHETTFTRKWRLQMTRSNKVIVSKFRDITLQESILMMAVGDKQHHEMMKDICLLQAALETDRRIVSLDENTARKYFTQAAKTIPKLQEIVWVNPDKPEETPIEWLKADAPADDFRMLGYSKSLQK